MSSGPSTSSISVAERELSARERSALRPGVLAELDRTFDGPARWVADSR